MIELHSFPTPNGWKASIALEELELPYEYHPVNIARGEQFEPAFLAISPNNRVPAILDRDPPGGGAPIPVFESGAILLYLAEKTGRLLPQDLRRRVVALEWLNWQMGNQGPMAGQAGHFRNYAPEKLAYAIERYTKEATRLYGVLDKQLDGREFIADEFSVADIICWPWTVLHDHHGQALEDYPNLHRWHLALRARPAVERACGEALGVFEKPAQLDAEARRNLFGHKPSE